MSVVSKNPFDLLGDDGEQSSPAPAKSTPAAAATAGAKKAPNAAEGTVSRNVPGAAGGNRGGNRGGRYPSRGGPRNVARGGEDKGPRNTGPDAATGTPEGLEGPGGFDGERVPAPKRAHNGPDKHTKGPRGEGRVNTSGGHRSRPAGGARGAKTPAFGGERRQYERRSGTNPDSQKKVEQGWGSNEGQAELTAEVEGEKDAQGEETVPGTPAAEDASGWGATDAPAAEGEKTEEAAAEAEPEEVQKSYDDFLAEKAASAFAFGKKEGRQVTGETLEGKAFVREGIDEFFTGKDKASAPKTKAAKKEKVYIEVDGQFATPAGRPPRENRENRGERGGRGGRGRGEGRGRGGNRGGQRGGFGGARSNGPSANISDEKAFPALGA